MSALFDAREARLEPMRMQDLGTILSVEQQAYDHPWTHANFVDSLHVGYHCQMLCAGGAPRHPTHLLGYFVAMKGVDEVHLLNFTIAPACHRQGWAPLLLEALCTWARGESTQWIWLEVRESNLRAQQVYFQYGFRRVGLRRGYYPAVAGQREDAIVMNLRLKLSHSDWGGLHQ